MYYVLSESANLPNSPHRKDLLSPLTKKPSIDLDEPMDEDDVKTRSDLPSKQTLPPLEK